MENTPFKNGFLLSVGGLVLFGLVVLATASAVLAFRHTGDNYYYLKHQLLSGVIPGIVMFFLASRFPHQRLKKIAIPMMLFSIVLMMLVFVPGLGIQIGKATRWIDFGFFSFQPSELLKLACVVYLAALFESRKRDITRVQESFVPFLCISGVVGILLIAQPDLGTLSVVMSIALSVYFLAGAKMAHVGAIILLGLMAFTIFVFGFGYERDRIEVFLGMRSDVADKGYQMNMALRMIEESGVAGIGYGQSQQKSTAYLPEPMGDSIFAVVAQELGFFGITVAIALFGMLGWQGYAVARAAPTMFGGILAGGIISWILIQATINISAISGLIPLTGIPLPFISYGSTSYVVLLTACGVVYNIQRTSEGVRS